MNEADTRARLIEPKLKASGWTDQQITREYYYTRDYQYTRGRIILIGDRVRRGAAHKVDYLLRVSEGFPIAVVEAEAEGEPAGAGPGQATEYVEDLALAFAYSTNGRVIIEYDFFTHSSRTLVNFPRPEELWQRWRLNTDLTSTQQYGVAEERAIYGVPGEWWKGNPLLYPYCPESICGRSPFC